MEKPSIIKGTSRNSISLSKSRGSTTGSIRFLWTPRSSRGVSVVEISISRDPLKHQHKGFTLIEIVITLLILAIVGAIMMVGLQSAIRSQNRITQKVQRLATLQSAIIVMERDIAQIINRPVIDVDGTTLPSVWVRYPAGQLNLEFTRAGFINPLAMQNRTTLQRVRYSWDGNSLIRTTWRALDRTPTTPLDIQVLLSGVKSFNVRFMDNNHQLAVPGESLLQQQPPPLLPLAIEVNLDIDDIGFVTRLIPLAN